MARIRSIKPEFFTSEQVVECSSTARLLFVGMWCFCDDNGIHPASTKTLKMQIFPGDDLTDTQIRDMVSELVTHELLEEYTVDGKHYWRVTGWKHQRIDKPSYRYPLPQHSENVPGAFVEDSKNDSGAFDDGPPAEGSGGEGSLMERSRGDSSGGDARKKIPVSEVSVEMVAEWARKQIPSGINLSHELAKFQNHEWKKAEPGDGVRAFRKWLLKAVEIKTKDGTLKPHLVAPLRAGVVTL